MLITTFAIEDQSMNHQNTLISKILAQHMSENNLHNTSVESVLPPIKIKKKPARSHSKEYILCNDSDVILVGNNFKSELKNKSSKRSYYPDFILPTPQKRVQKKVRVPPKFNGIYFEDEKYSQDLEFQSKYASLRTYYNIINLSNGIYVINTIPYYKAYIGKGNNGQLVKQVLKSRWWWQTIENEKYTANFLWQQLRNNNYIEQLQQCDSIMIEKQNIRSVELPIPYNQLIQGELQQQIEHIFKQNGKNSKILTLDQIKEINPQIITFNPQKFHNHLQDNKYLGSKKWLYIIMKQYYKDKVHDYLPLTYLIKNNLDLLDFVEQQKNEQCIWIIKPGELTNRGNGIHILSDMKQISNLVKGTHTHRNGQQKSYIIQKYIQNPLLYNNRKFDIRCFILYTVINNQHKGYWYQEGYIRTSSQEYNLKDLDDLMVHLTNDAVQKNHDDYGKYEKGNKISFDEFAKGLNIHFIPIYNQMKTIATNLFNAVIGKIDSNKKGGFELFGLDFMVDQQLKVWLIECNTNPCLETTGPLLQKLIPQLLDNLFKLVLDPIFPPPTIYIPKKLPYESIENKFEMIYN